MTSFASHQLYEVDRLYELEICGSQFFTCRTEMLHPNLDEIIETPHLPILKQKVIMVALLVPVWEAGRH